MKTTTNELQRFAQNNIFNQRDSGEIIKRIHALGTHSAWNWGSLSLPEMLEHCTIQLKMALYELPATQAEGSFILRTSLGKWMGLYGPQWPKNSDTPSQMNIKQQSLTIENFEGERAKLLQYLNVVLTKDSFQEHPFFGKLDKKDWGRLIWKHFDHHLRQFGA